MYKFTSIFTERTIVMCLSYIIGFTAAFIAYGLTDFDLKFVGEPAAVATTSLTVLTSSSVTSETKSSSKTATGVKYDENLYAIVDGEEIIISADRKHGEGIGFYDSIASFELLNGGSVVRFCAFENENDSTCIRNEYSVSEHYITRFKN